MSLRSVDADRLTAKTKLPFNDSVTRLPDQDFSAEDNAALEAMLSQPIASSPTKVKELTAEEKALRDAREREQIARRHAQRRIDEKKAKEHADRIAKKQRAQAAARAKAAAAAAEAAGPGSSSSSRRTSAKGRAGRVSRLEPLGTKLLSQRGSSSSSSSSSKKRLDPTAVKEARAIVTNMTAIGKLPSGAVTPSLATPSARSTFNLATTAGFPESPSRPRPDPPSAASTPKPPGGTTAAVTEELPDDFLDVFGGDTDELDDTAAAAASKTNEVSRSTAQGASAAPKRKAEGLGKGSKTKRARGLDQQPRRRDPPPSWAHKSLFSQTISATVVERDLANLASAEHKVAALHMESGMSLWTDKANALFSAVVRTLGHGIYISVQASDPVRAAGVLAPCPDMLAQVGDMCTAHACPASAAIAYALAASTLLQIASLAEPGTRASASHVSQAIALSSKASVQADTAATSSGVFDPLLYAIRMGSVFASLDVVITPLNALWTSLPRNAQ